MLSSQMYNEKSNHCVLWAESVSKKMCITHCLERSSRFSCCFQRSMEDSMNAVPAFYAAFKCYRKIAIGNLFAETWRDFGCTTLRFDMMGSINRGVACDHSGKMMSKVKSRCIESHKRTPLTDWKSIFLRGDVLGTITRLSRVSHRWHEQNYHIVFPASWSWTDTWWWKHLSPVKVSLDTRDASQTFKAVHFYTLSKEASSRRSGWMHLALNFDRKMWNNSHLG